MNVLDGSSDFTANERIQTKIPNWEIYRNTTFTKDHIIAAAGLKKSSTNEVHKLVSNGLKLEHDVAKYLRCAHLVESDAPDAAQDAAEIQALEAEYDDMRYKEFKVLITQEVEEQQDNKPGPSKGAKGKGKAKRAHSEDGSGDNEQRKSKEKKRDTDTTTKEIKRLEKLLNKLKAKKGDEMDSDDLD